MKMPNSGIYKIINIFTGKIYVGSAVNLTKRLANHKSDLTLNKHHNVYLQRAWNKYWSVSFKFETIEYCEKEKLIEREQYWIDTLNCVTPNGYNLNPTAGSNLGMIWPDSFKEKISKTLTGRKLTEAHKANKFSFKVGHVPTKETCDKISKALIGKNFDNIHKSKLSHSRLKFVELKKSVNILGYMGAGC